MFSEIEILIHLDLVFASLKEALEKKRNKAKEKKIILTFDCPYVFI